MMKHMTFALLLLTLSLWPATGHANVAPIKGTIARGVKLCKAGRFAKGIDTIVDGAMELRRVAPKHPLNRTWRTKLNRCFRSWINKAGSRCTKKRGCRIRYPAQSTVQRRYFGLSWDQACHKEQDQILLQQPQALLQSLVQKEPQSCLLPWRAHGARG